MAEETSPDMLKNTPSNIRRLANEIEQCEGRQKYLAQTTSPSDGGDVRWYFCKVPLAHNEVSASVPRTEVVGKSEYFRFGMRDSLAIESAFLQEEEDLLSSWWREYADCSEGPRERHVSPSKLDVNLKSSVLESTKPSELFTAEEERVGVPVKGGLYEVDLVKRHCFPVYWNGEDRRVLRGQWFALNGGLDWLPLREDVAEQLEFAYRGRVWRRRTFQQSGLFAARVDLQGSTLGLHALFTGEDDTWEAWLKSDASGFSISSSLGRNGIRLRRGYASSQSLKPTQDELRQQKEEEMDDYCSEVPVRHLVFMVHGIGQRLEKSNLVDDVTTFRQITATLAERHLTRYQRGKQRVLFIPCQWRRHLKLSGESAIEKITLDGLRGFRVMLSATAHDILYYMSPVYGQAIIDSVSNQLNRLYLKFLKRNPGYDGKVSLYGHSLGSVLSYDILCHQENCSSAFSGNLMYNESFDKEPSYPGHVNKHHLEKSSVSNVNFERKGVEELVDKDTPSIDSKLSHVEGHSVEYPVTLLSVSSANDQSPVPVGSAQPNNDLPIDEDVTRPIVDHTNILTSESDESNITKSIKNGDFVGCSNDSGADVCESNEVKLIDTLKEEINFLRDRLKELESGSNKGSVTCSGTDKEPSVTSQPVSEVPSVGKNDSVKSYTPYINYKKLKFEVDTFFAVGSPLGVFLALRNVRIGIGKGHEYWDEENIIEEMPACRRMFNIFHPFDPVAYRIEPLVCKEYISRRPVIIPYHRGGKRLHIGFREFTEELSARSKAVSDRIDSIKVKVITICQSRNNDSNDDESDSTQEIEERSYGSFMLESLTESEHGRIDHVLQDKTFQHAYISAVGAHTNYWRDYDTALFMLKHLYRDTPEEPNISVEAEEGNSSKHNNDSECWYDQREIDDEEFPLTFSDKVSIKDFSRKAKKVMKW